MGTKRLLAPRIAELVGTMADGPFLDLFSGIAAVGSQIGTGRPIWCNDVQQFSTLLTRRKFKAAKAFVGQSALADAAMPIFEKNRSALFDAFADLLAKEQDVLYASCPAALTEQINEISAVSGSRRSQLCASGHHSLFATTHAGTYFGLRQAIEIDSIRYAADSLHEAGRIGEDEHQWMILALCQVLSSSSNSTGHFAQYLSPNAANIHRILRKRRRNIWEIWKETLRTMRPAGTVKWRRGNRVFNADAVKLLHALARKTQQPSVIYADPPYTSDQYSRYYHVLENIILYDYPATAGKGQYRPDRFTSGFSLKSAVNKSFAELVEAASRLDAVFILSYPTNGLLEHSTKRVLEILDRHFAHVDAPIVIPHMHSTMGGSKGAQKQAVDENIFVAYQSAKMRHRDLPPSETVREKDRIPAQVPHYQQTPGWAALSVSVPV